MEKMSVAIMTAERAFARALARGLAEESSGLTISFCITDTADAGSRGKDSDLRP